MTCADAVKYCTQVIVNQITHCTFFPFTHFMVISHKLAGDCLLLRVDRRLLRWEGVDDVVPSELWEGVGLLR